jgi:hypothetical protein
MHVHLARAEKVQSSNCCKQQTCLAVGVVAGVGFGARPGSYSSPFLPCVGAKRRGERATATAAQGATRAATRAARPPAQASLAPGRARTAHQTCFVSVSLNTKPLLHNVRGNKGIVAAIVAEDRDLAKSEAVHRKQNTDGTPAATGSPKVPSKLLLRASIPRPVQGRPKYIRTSPSLTARSYRRHTWTQPADTHSVLAGNRRCSEGQ